MNPTELARRLLQRIESGQYPAGSMLPSQAELASEFAVSRHCVRHAQANLLKRGVLRSWQGKGVAVAASRFDYPIFSRTRFGEQLRAVGHDVKTEFLGSRVARGPLPVNRLLGLPASARLLQVLLRREVDKLPAVLARHYYDPQKLPEIDEAISRLLSVTEAMREQEISIVRFSTSMETRLPTGREAIFLGVPPLQPLIEITGLNVDAAKNPVEVSIALARGDRIRLCVRSPK